MRISDWSSDVALPISKLARNCLVRQVAAQSAQYMDFPIGHLNEHRPSEDVERRRLGNGPERADVVGAVDRAAHPAEKRPSVGRVDAECVQNAVECLDRKSTRLNSSH